MAENLFKGYKPSKLNFKNALPSQENELRHFRNLFNKGPKQGIFQIH